MAKDKENKKSVAPALSKKEAIKTAIESIEKAYGKGSIMRLGNQPIAKVPTISTGSISLDMALGVGGVPRGRTIEIYGPESSGKTTMSLQIIAEAQREGGVCAFIDVEHALDLNNARGIGVDVGNLHFSQPDNAEQALETAEMLATGQFDVVVVDSVSALVPRAEVEGSMGDASIGVQARLMSQALRKLTSVVSKSGTVLIFINQIRMKIGVMFGNPETTSGGNALKFYASVRLDVRRIQGIEGSEKGVYIGNRLKVKIVKNKVAPPFRQTELELIFGKGISKELDIVETAVKYGIIERSGAWYSYKDGQIGQGLSDAADFLKRDPIFASSLRSQIIEKLTPKEEEAVAESQD